MKILVGMHLVRDKAGSGRTRFLRQFVDHALDERMYCWVYASPGWGWQYGGRPMFTWDSRLDLVLHKAHTWMRKAHGLVRPQPLLLVIDSLDDVADLNNGPDTASTSEVEVLAALAQGCVRANMRVVAALQTEARLPDKVMEHVNTVHHSSGVDS